MKLINVKKSYEKKVVFEDLTLFFPEGGITALMGASGCGKTTVLRLLLGLEEADEGEVTVGEPAAAVFQENRLCDSLNALENVLLVKKDGDRAAALSLLHALGLEGHTEKAARELSGGMRRRVAIARALFADTPYLFLDEPFTGLDEETKADVMALVKERLAGKTVLLVTHDEEEARSLTDIIYLMEAGDVRLLPKDEEQAK